MKKMFRKVCLLAALTGVSTGAADFTSAASNGHPSLTPEKTLNVAHRGASGYAPEHTIAAYELGEQMKGDYIEVDLQMTKDGELIAMHDETLDRTTNGTGSVKDFTLEEIKQLDAGSWFNEKYPEYASSEFIGLQVPTLEEVIQHFGKDARYYIETKSPDVYPGMEKALLEVLNEYKLIGSNTPSSKVIIQSFSEESLQVVHKLNPDVPLVQLLWYDKAAVITDAELEKYKEYSIGLGMNFAQIDEAYVQKVREHDLLIHPYTVNEQEDMKKLLDWGVTGMFTNFPDRLQEVLHAAK